MKQGPQTMRQVIAPKVGAVQNFATCAAAAPLQYSLLCSSVSAIAGYSGQVRGSSTPHQALWDSYHDHRPGTDTSIRDARLLHRLIFSLLEDTHVRMHSCRIDLVGYAHAQI